jgi:hypothetical protein
MPQFYGEMEKPQDHFHFIGDDDGHTRSAVAAIRDPQDPVSNDESSYESCIDSDNDADNESESSYEPGDGSNADGLSDELKALFDDHLSLITRKPAESQLDEINTAPLFTGSVWRMAQSNNHDVSADIPSTQYGLLGGNIDMLHHGGDQRGDPRVFHNVTSPSSVFICGSQGSGKSHTLSCLLENCLIPSSAGVLPKPLAGVVFHYDTFSSDTGGSPCEAAYLSSSRDVKVRVLCPPTNVQTIKVRIKLRHGRVC